jgi:hypothetical protein
MTLQEASISGYLHKGGGSLGVEMITPHKEVHDAL